MNTKVKEEELDSPTQELLMSLFKARRVELARFGDGRYIMPSSYKEEADKVVDMAVRPDDTWVITFPRSGTTWTQELVWLLNNDLDYETAAKIPLIGRYMFLELHHTHKTEKLSQEQIDPAILKKFLPSFEAITIAPSPRFIKTHLPFSLLPPNLLDTSKVVYVTRDPRDVAVSYYHHNRFLRSYTGDFKTYWNLFVNDLVLWAPFFTRLKGAWTLRHHENMLFLFYEDMAADLASVAKRVSKFFGKEVTDEQIKKLCEHLDITNFKKNKSVNWAFYLDISDPNDKPFIRKGGSGGWREYFDEEMAAQAQRWINENLADTGLSFPQNAS